MKKLQNNFTTPEQSKRLMEIGVPADSADCYYNMVRLVESSIINVRTSFQKSMSNFWKEHYPCWSVGRLLEIMALCYKFDFPNNGSVQVYVTDIKKGITADVLISDIERFINKIDFSKLKE